MQDDVRAQFQGILQVRCAEGVVHQHGNALGLGDFHHGGNVGQNQRRVGRSFQVDQFGLLGDGPGEVGRVVGRNLGDGDAHARQRLGEELVSAAVKGVAGHDVVTHLATVQHRGGRRGHAAGQSQGGFTLFQIGELGFEGRLGGVAQPRVDVAGILAPENGRAMFGVLEGEGRALEDGGAHRTDGFFALVFVQVLLAVDAKRGEAGFLVLGGHHLPPFLVRGRCFLRSATLSRASQEKSLSGRPKWP